MKLPDITRLLTSPPALCTVVLLMTSLLSDRPALAQLTLTLAPAASGQAGGPDIIVSGELHNTGATDLAFSSANFDVLNGPAGADLTTALSVSDYFAPFTLTAGQDYFGSIFSIAPDPSALNGSYTANFSVQYDSAPVQGRDIIVTLGPAPAAPEPSGLISLSLGLSAAALLVLRRRRGLA